ncbi:MAG TPA: hypothetical protein VGM41_17850 [Chitinophagaceae bacterium]|jgi:hypothetical protein
MKWKFYLLTWVLSIAFNIGFVAVVLFVQAMLHTHQLPMKDELLNAGQDFYVISLFSVPFSAPGMLALLASTYLSDFFLNRRGRFVFIIISCMVGTFLSYLLLWGITGLDPFSKIAWSMPVSLAAVLTALLIQRKLFYKAFMPL